MSFDHISFSPFSFQFSSFCVLMSRHPQLFRPNSTLKSVLYRLDEMDNALNSVWRSLSDLRQEQARLSQMQDDILEQLRYLRGTSATETQATPLESPLAVTPPLAPTYNWEEQPAAQGLPILKQVTTKKDACTMIRALMVRQDLNPSEIEAVWQKFRRGSRAFYAEYIDKRNVPLNLTFAALDLSLRREMAAGFAESVLESLGLDLAPAGTWFAEKLMMLLCGWHRNSWIRYLEKWAEQQGKRLDTSDTLQQAFLDWYYRN
ncbi:hypothetical protein BC940DRAFT_354643 [Gongronella butleri]|nr:hypothetical protein BC940DRAFT_354643 [Gongronella butleri]